MRPGPDISKIKKRKAKGLPLTRNEEHLLRLDEAQQEEVRRQREYVARPKEERRK